MRRGVIAFCTYSHVIRPSSSGQLFQLCSPVHPAHSQPPRVLYPRGFQGCFEGDAKTRIGKLSPIWPDLAGHRLLPPHTEFLDISLIFGPKIKRRFIFRAQWSAGNNCKLLARTTIPSDRYSRRDPVRQHELANLRPMRPGQLTSLTIKLRQLESRKLTSLTNELEQFESHEFQCPDHFRWPSERILEPR